MLLTLLYHRAAEGKYANSPDMMKAHLEHLAKNYPVVLPGEPLSFMKTHVCLTFDDAFFDFYHIIYPLLQDLDLRAILAVPTKFILERTEIDPNIRLQVPTRLAQKEYLTKAPYCTWEEIQEMVNSGHVEIASHSHSHPSMTGKNVNLEKEIIGSKAILESRLNIKISTFIYPFGAFNQRIHRLVNKHYSYAMRIGSAGNQKWSPLIYRISADNLKKYNAPFKMPKYISYWMRWGLNKVRNK